MVRRAEISHLVELPVELVSAAWSGRSGNGSDPEGGGEQRLA
jgi:hypothetical protein